MKGKKVVKKPKGIESFAIQEKEKIKVAKVYVLINNNVALMNLELSPST